MSEREDLEELLRAAYEHRAQALECELDRRLSRLWRAPERRLLKPALALASVALLFLGAWLYDLSQSGGAGPIVLDERYERPQLVLKQPGDPVALTDQLAGRAAQAPPLQLIEPKLDTGIFRFEEGMYTAVADDGAGNQFLAEESGRIVKRSFTDRAIQAEVVLEGLDHPNGLAFDRDGSLLVLESGKGRILRVEPVEGEIKAGSPVSVLAEGFSRSVAQDSERMKQGEHLALELAPEERGKSVYLAVSERGEIFVGEQLDGEAVVYKIGRKSFKWWKFYCLYRC